MLFSVSLCLMLPDFAWALELVVRRCHALRKGEKSCEVEPEQTMDGQRAGGTGIIHKRSLYVVFGRGRSCRELQQPHGHEGLAGHLCKVFPPLHLAPQHPRVNFRLAGTAPFVHRQPARGLSCAAGRGYQFSVVYRWEFLALSSFVPTLLLLWIAI